MLRTALNATYPSQLFFFSSVELTASALILSEHVGSPWTRDRPHRAPRLHAIQSLPDSSGADSLNSPVSSTLSSGFLEKTQNPAPPSRCPACFSDDSGAAPS